MKCDTCHFAVEGVTPEHDNCMDCIRRAETVQMILIFLVPLSFIAGYTFKTIEKFID